MIDFGVTFLGIFAAALLPALLGLLVVMVFRGAPPRYTAAFAFGVFLWYFSDTIGDSSYLGVNKGFSGGSGQLVLLLMFTAGLSLFIADRHGFGARQATNFSFAPSLLVAFALSVHGFSEGAAFGALASSAQGTTLNSVLGGYGPAIGYVLHKVLEASIIGAAFIASSGIKMLNQKKILGEITVLGVVFTIPSLLGTTFGYYVQFETAPFFALATGTSVYVALRLAETLIGSGTTSYSESLKVVLLLLLGFFAIYAAALFHSTYLGG